MTKLRLPSSGSTIQNTAVPYKIRRKTTAFLLILFRSVIIIGISYIILSPILMKISISFMDQIDLYDKTVKFIPKTLRLDNYIEALHLMNFPSSLLTTMGLSAICAVLQMFSCVIVGYGFAHFDIRFKNLLFVMVIISMIIPPQIVITPTYLNFLNFDPLGLIGLINNGKGLKLLDNISPFMLLSLTATGPKNGLYIFLARQFFKGIPKEIDEAASIDGAGPVRTFASIMLRAALPMMVTIFLFSFVWQWNDSLYTFLFYPSLSTIPKYLQDLGYLLENVNVTISQTATNIGYVSIMQATCTLISILPLLVLYGFTQKFFVQSIERTGLVG